MNQMNSKSPIAAAVGAALAVSFAAAAPAQADVNPFSMSALSSGYMVDMGEGKCGEGKCGGDKAEAEGKCGEGKCGEGKCGGEKSASVAEKASSTGGAGAVALALGLIPLAVRRRRNS
ncbi:MAG: hypothetical protein AB8G18_11745 [Gammaproteobacteria bacterium]